MYRSSVQVYSLCFTYYLYLKKRARDAAENSRAESTTTTTTAMCVCMVTHIAKIRINRVRKVANPARGQLNREKQYFFPVRVRA